MRNDLARMTLDALGECVFNYGFNTIEAGDTKISCAFTDIFAGFNSSVMTVTRKLFQRFPFLKSFIKQDEAHKIIFQVTKQVRAANIPVNILFVLKSLVLLF